MTTPAFYGRGISMPMRLDPTTQSRIVIARDEDKIRRSMEDIVNTPYGARPFCVKNGILYGTRYEQALFNPSEIAIEILTYEIPQALAVWEPRIVLLETVGSVDAGDPSNIAVTTRFKYRSTNRSDNFVAPFRLRSRT